jgi:hypothetical protein
MELTSIRGGKVAADTAVVIEVTNLTVQKQAVPSQMANAASFVLLATARAKDTGAAIPLSEKELVTLRLTRGATVYEIVGAEVGVIKLLTVEHKDREPEDVIEFSTAGGTYRCSGVSVLEPA